MTPDQLDGALDELARLVLTEKIGDSFRAKAAALGPIGPLDAAGFAHLHRRLHDPTPEPPDYDYRTYGLGGWISATQFAVFELVMQTGEDGIDWMLGIARGPYDWTQGNALECLLRHAAAGRRRETLIAEIANLWPDLRYEARLYALEPLARWRDTDTGLRGVLDDLAHRSDAFLDTLIELTET